MSIVVSPGEIRVSSIVRFVNRDDVKGWSVDLHSNFATQEEAITVRRQAELDHYGETCP